MLARADEREFPDAVAGAEEVLGIVAREQRRLDEAITHWDRAERLHRAEEQWSQAARAAASSASVAKDAGRADAELWRRWAEAAELSERAGIADDARTCGVNASVYAVKVLKTPTEAASWDAARVRAAALDARAFAMRFGADHEAAHLAVLVAVATNDLASSPDEVFVWTAVARAEYAGLERSGADLDMWPVFNDFTEGNAAITAGDPVRAEPALRRALAGYERAGDAERARACRLQLLTIAHAGEPGGGPADKVIRNRDWPDPDSAAVASLVEEHLAQREGRIDDAERHHARTRRLLLEAGEPVKAVVHGIAHGTWRLERGDHAGAARALAGADACLAEPPPGAPLVALRMVRNQRDLLRAALAAAQGDRHAAIVQLAAVEDALLAGGSRMLAAQTAVQRGRLLLAAGDPAEALTAALPAALALDAIRFTFADAGRRHRWGALASAGFALGFRAAVAAGRPRVLAELIEVARGAGVPVPVEGPATGIESLLADATRDALAGTDDATTPGAAGTTSVEAVSGPAALADPARTAIGLPARLRAPWGTIAVADALESARRYLDPVRAETVTDWVLTTGPAR